MINNRQQTNFKWWYSLIGYGAMLIAFTINTLLITNTESFLKTTAFNLGSLFNAIQFILIGILALFAVRSFSKNRLNRVEFGIHLKSIYSVIGIATIIGLLYYGLSEFASYHIESIKEASKEVAKSLKIGDSLVDDILLLLSIGLLAPIVEEIVFRGIIFNSLTKGLKRYSYIPNWLALGIGLVVSSFAFASIHGGGGQDEQTWFFVIMSVFTALSLYYTKNLFAPIFVHAINNNIVFLLLIYDAVGFQSSHGIIITICCMACLLLCVPVTLGYGRILSMKQ